MKNITLALCLSLSLSACNTQFLHEDSLMVVDRPSVVEQSDYERYPTLKLDTGSIDHIANRYYIAPNTALKMSAIYDPEKDPYFCDERKVNALKYQLKKRGITNVTIEKLPVVGAQSQLLLNYESLALAESPECIGQNMPGLGGTQPGDNYNYLLGCSMARMEMKQIANPAHALGVAGVGGSQMEGTRAANIVNGVTNNGDPRDFVPGYVISETGGATE
ncbi:MAG: hypothetical protein CMH30_06605 [Micavibrio sp.]|nr:hypothetical protein [Micavibrio sp.]|tara:strand:- start:3592 stop:4248 length:657 start_codon:yes stop_codon:yes gene_type:complete